MKLTKEQIKKIGELKQEGISARKVSIELNLNYQTTLYYYNPKIKEYKIKYQKEYQKKNKPVRGDKYREYQRVYHNKRYWRLKDSIQEEGRKKTNE